MTATRMDEKLIDKPDAAMTNQPVAYDSAEALNEAVERYSEQANQHPTPTGLALHLGFDSLQSLKDYGDQHALSYPINRALLDIECHYEQALIGPDAAEAIVILKQLGWTDEVQRVDTITLYTDPLTGTNS